MVFLSELHGGIKPCTVDKGRKTLYNMNHQPGGVK